LSVRTTEAMRRTSRLRCFYHLATLPIRSLSVVSLSVNSRH
jgi:hypothetical protein